MKPTTPVLAGCALLSIGSVAQAATMGLYVSHADHVLGTSLDLKLIASSEAGARRAEQKAMQEINRLTGILSGYDTQSEFSRWAATQHEAIPVSEDLFSVLQLFDQWHGQTNGALSASAQTISQLWQQGAIDGQTPSAAAKAEAIDLAGQTHWLLEPASRTATRVSTAPLRLNTFTKSYIINKACEAAMTVDGIDAVVVNAGGDIIVRGKHAAPIAVVNPRASAENDAPMARLSVQNQAVATSGDYRRGVQIDGNWYSHVVDPRTGEPASEVISATVVHPDAVVAGALSTAFNVASAGEREELTRAYPEAAYLLVTKDGKQLSNAKWSDLAVTMPESTAVLVADASDRLMSAKVLGISAAKPWNPDYELSINLELAKFEGRFRRPFVAVWVEDEDRNPVRNIALWYNKPRWLHELKSWYNNTRQQEGFDPASIAGATRSPGAYTLKWDGKDDKGQFVKAGKYTVVIEVAREHGTYQIMRKEMSFNAKAKQETLEGNVEISAASLDYHKKTGNP
ncbi:DUF2271 domain-containing protein [Arsenicibacter rosenii]|uniref:FAD:protein FMN transferase n=1 Tax=Arsenicibacter rosenii TaxID=1750698 RepID=A0A1S2VK39_9BACT|nr:DUF2271 domain-containing protein [Arsenicibacter rosenii]OIN58556.1 ApbE family lipoprotein [Arsenicibacter rosenii]